MNWSKPGLPAHHKLSQFTQTRVHRVGDAFQPSHPLLSPSPPDLNLSHHQGLFEWVSSSHQVAKVLGFSISPSNEHPGLTSFRMDWLDLLAVQGTQESSPTPQFKSINYQHSAFFTVQLSHPYMTTGKTIALTRWTFVGKVMSLLFNMLSRLAITFLPRSKRLFFLSVFYFIFPFIFISWRLITLHYCSGFCHTLTWISHGVTCIPHPDPPSHLPLSLLPLGLPMSSCLMHPTWAGDLSCFFTLLLEDCACSCKVGMLAVVMLD